MGPSRAANYGSFELYYQTFSDAQPVHIPTQTLEIESSGTHEGGKQSFLGLVTGDEEQRSIEVGAEATTSPVCRSRACDSRAGVQDIGAIDSSLRSPPMTPDEAQKPPVL